MAQVVTYNANAIVCMEGEINNFIYMIKEGRVSLTYEDLSEKKRIKTNLNSGDMFGVNSALLKHPSLETAKTVSAAEILVIEGDEFINNTSSHSEISFGILNNVFQQFQQLLDSNFSEQKTVMEENRQHGMFQLLNYYLFNDQFEKAGYVRQMYLASFKDGAYRQKVDNCKIHIDKKRLPDNIRNEIKQFLEKQHNTEEMPAKGEDAVIDLILKKALSLKVKKDYQQAILLLYRFINSVDNEQAKITARFELCGCYLLNHNFGKCLDNLLLLIQECPDFAEKNSLVKMAKLCYAKTKDIDKTDEFLRYLMSSGADEKTLIEAGNQLLYMAKMREL